MKRLLSALLVTAAASLAPALVYAQATPVGLWKTIDDNTKTERSQLRITEDAGALSGKIEKLLATDVKPDAVCHNCSDDRKDKPLIGLEVLRGVTKSKEDNTWEGGSILDPANGKSYKVRLRPVEGGTKLEVRAYLGVPLLGRTQTWVRVE